MKTALHEKGTKVKDKEMAELIKSGKGAGLKIEEGHMKPKEKPKYGTN